MEIEMRNTIITLNCGNCENYVGIAGIVCCFVRSSFLHPTGQQMTLSVSFAQGKQGDFFACPG